MLVRDFLGDVIWDRLAMPKDDRPEDLLNGVLQGMDEDKSSIDSSHRSETTISYVLMGLLFAGYDTTSITLTYALYHVATLPEVEKACLDVTDPDAL